MGWAEEGLWGGGAATLAAETSDLDVLKLLNCAVRGCGVGTYCSESDEIINW